MISLIVPPIALLVSSGRNSLMTEPITIPP